VPCRVGSTKLAEIGADLLGGKLTATDVAELKSDTGPVQELHFTMVNTAICGLGTVAPNPLVSLLKHFPDEVTKYVTH
jgi:NADH:ubiquinone oxidoreductase subunit F (NADH-binding)